MRLVNAVRAVGARNTQQQQTPCRAQGNSAAGQSQRQAGAAYNHQFPALPQMQGLTQRQSWPPQHPKPQQQSWPQQQPARVQQPTAQSMPVGQNQGNGGKASPRGRHEPFTGICRICKNVVHRAAECPRGAGPDTQCNRCQGYGHISRECWAPAPVARRPLSPRKKSCQLCCREDTVATECARCAPSLSRWMGNLLLGGQE